MSKRMTLQDVEKLPEWARKQIKDQLPNVRNMLNKATAPVSPLDCSERLVQGRVDANTRLKLILRLPIYYATKNRTMLIGLNVYRNAHFSLQHKIKKYISAIAAEQLNQPPKTAYSRVLVDYVLWYKNVQSDAMNVVSCLDKFLLDQLQVSGYLKNDNVTTYKGGSWIVAGQDKKNPRIECVVQLWELGK